MQYKITQKIVIDKRKLDILLRLGCPDKQLLELIKTGSFTKTGDFLIDETLECLIDFKDFKNWGGNHNPTGVNQYTQNKSGQVDHQVDHQVEGQVEGQDIGQVVDKDKDKDKDRDINNTLSLSLLEKKENNIKEKREDETGRPVSTIPHSFDWFINRWNENVSGRGCAPSIRVLTDDRKRRLKQIIPIAVKGYPDLSEEEAVFKVISNYNNSRFLKGETPERFVFNVDFVLNKRHFLKLMEGGYDDKF